MIRVYRDEHTNVTKGESFTVHAITLISNLKLVVLHGVNVNATSTTCRVNQLIHSLLLSYSTLIQWNLQIKDTLERGFCPLLRGCPLVGGSTHVH